MTHNDLSSVNDVSEPPKMQEPAPTVATIEIAAGGASCGGAGDEEGAPIDDSIPRPHARAALLLGKM